MISSSNKTDFKMFAIWLMLFVDACVFCQEIRKNKKIQNYSEGLVIEANGFRNQSAKEASILQYTITKMFHFQITQPSASYTKIIHKINNKLSTQILV